MSMSFRKPVSSLKKRLPQHDDDLWMATLIFALGMLIYVLLGRR